MAGGKKSGRSRKNQKSITVNSEWIVGEVESSLFVTENGDEGFHPIIVIVLDQNSLVIASEAVNPNEPRDWFRILSHAFQKPLMGAPRIPSAIRTDDKERGRQIELGFPGIKIITAPTPEIYELASEIEGRFEFQSVESLMIEESVDHTTIGNFFVKAKEICRLKIWEYIKGEDLIRVDYPAKNIVGGCIIFFNDPESNPGIFFFPTFKKFEKFFKEVQEESEADFAKDSSRSGVFIINFVKGANVPDNIRKQVERENWPVFNANSYPFPAHLTMSREPIPCDEDDMILLTNILSSFSDFFSLNIKSFSNEEEEVEPISSAMESRSSIIQYTFPYDSYKYFYKPTVSELEQLYAQLKKEPENARILTDIGSILTDDANPSNFKKGVGYLKKAIKYDRNLPQPYMYLAKAEGDNKNNIESAQLFEKAAGLFEKQSDHGMAMRMWEATAAMLTQEGWKFLIKKENKQALKYGYQALSVYSSSIQAFNLIGCIHFNEMEFIEAINYFSQGEKIGREYLKSLQDKGEPISFSERPRLSVYISLVENYGKSLSLLNRHEEAMDIYLKFINQSPQGDKNVARHIGHWLPDIYLSLHQAKKAEQSLNQFGEHSIGYTKVLLYITLEKEKEAKELLMTCLNGELVTGLLLLYYIQLMSGMPSNSNTDQVDPVLHKKVFMNIEKVLFPKPRDFENLPDFMKGMFYIFFSAPLWIRTTGAYQMLLETIQNYKPLGKKESKQLSMFRKYIDI
jgi:tetratricopeptide (TPR) repeat protein